MLDLDLPAPLELERPDVALYVQAALPPRWEAVIRGVLAVLHDEHGCRAAMTHIPHLTLHPVFFRRRTLIDLEACFRALTRTLPSGDVELGPVTAFEQAPGDISQIIVAVASPWCERVHAQLLQGLAQEWDPGDLLSTVLWPQRHRGVGYQPHLTLAIGDLPAAPERRGQALTRASEMYRRLIDVLAPPPRFTITKLQLLAYRADWHVDRHRLIAGPAVVASAMLAVEPS